MSVQHESVGTGKAAERTEAAPELEYRAVSQDSLSMFLAAIGGAILGMLLTLLVLALINGGTLTYAGDRLKNLESHLQQVDKNVGAVSGNINIVSEQAAAIQQQLGAVESALRNEIETQGTNIAAMNESMTTLNQTREQFDIFVGALTGALTEMGAIEAPTEASIEAPPLAAGAPLTETTALTATAPVTTAETVTESTLPTTSASVTATAAITTELAPTQTTEMTTTAAVTTATAITGTTELTATGEITEEGSITATAPVTQ